MVPFSVQTCVIITEYRFTSLRHVKKSKAMDRELFGSNCNGGDVQSSHTYWTEPLLCLRLSLDRLLLAALIGVAAGDGGAVPVLLKVRSLHVIVIQKVG